MWADLRLAARYARQRPGYTLICSAVLAVGLGACTAVFSVLYAAVLKPLPYPHPEQLVTVHNRFRNGPVVGASAADYFTLRAHHEFFVDAGAYYFLDLNRTGIEVPRKINAVAISSSLFGVLGAHPLIGRLFSEVEERFHGPRAVILSESYWENEFARDPQILHGSLRLNGELYPVIGVMPGSFAFPNEVTQMWTPLAVHDPGDKKSFYLRMYARIAPGLSFDRASRVVAATIPPQDDGRSAQRRDYLLEPVLRASDASVRRGLWILFAAVGFLLLIVCSNVAGMILVRALEQRSDLSIRMALGAGRWRIARQCLAEAFLLTGSGAAGGILSAQAALAGFARYGPAASARMEPAVFSFAIGLSVLTAIACGIFPALRSTGLAGTGSRHSAGRVDRRWQQALIVMQVGVATALLVCGGLLIHSLRRLLSAPLGFEPANVLTMQISLPSSRYAPADSRARFYDSLLDQAGAIPGVDAAAGCTLLPFGYGENMNTFEIVGRAKPAESRYAAINIISGHYLQAMRIPLLLGRTFTREEPVRAVLVDEAFLRREFGDENSLGRQVKTGWGGVYTIIGVVGSVKSSGIDIDSPPALYFSADQSPVTDLTLVIRTRAPGDQVVRTVERIVRSLDRDQPVYDIAPLQSRIDRSLKTRRFVVWLLFLFSIVGTVLATLGLYALLSYSIVARRREIGVRMALGAGSGAIARLVCGEGIALVAAGMAMGSAAAIAASRFLASQMYGIGFGDGAAWIAAMLILFVAALAGSAVPAWRAARISPSDALK